MGNLTSVSDADFPTAVIGASGPALVSYCAQWAGPCKLHQPIVEDVAAEHGDEVAFFTMDVDENPETAQSQGVTAVPTVIVYSAGEAVETLIGPVSKQAIVDALADYIG